VVGRTGAGKLTVFEGLFPMAEPDGSLLIDDVNIRLFKLHDLRNIKANIPVNVDLKCKYPLINSTGSVTFYLLSNT
jgi:hypothetical protein